MTDAAPANDGQATAEQAAAAASTAGPAAATAPTAGLPAAPAAASGAAPSAFDERPELAVGAAFAGGFVLALVLKRLAG